MPFTADLCSCMLIPAEEQQMAERTNVKYAQQLACARDSLTPQLTADIIRRLNHAVKAVGSRKMVAA